MKIEPVARPYREIAKANFLKIPPFQRPFSWTPDNIEEFWNDLVNIESGDYFLGSVVFFRDKKDSGSYFITDGQQRITTINIFLCALRDISHEIGLQDLSDGIHGFIENRDEDNRDRFVLKYDQSNKYFPGEILNRGSQGAEPVSEEEKNQKSAYDYFLGRIKNHLEGQLGSEYSGNDKTKELLQALRNSIINMQFVVLTLENEDDAFVIFETLNTRGKDLAVSDLIKNHFAKNIRSKNKDLNPVSERWGRIQGRLESVPSSVDFDTFLSHYWLSKEKYVSKKRLFKELKGRTPKSKAEERLKDIEKASSSYVRVLHPSADNWTKKEELEVRRSLHAIGLFSVAQARPLLLALVMAYEANLLSLKSLRRATENIENFTFQFNAITQSRGGGGIAGMYASLAQSISAAKTSQQLSDCQKIMTERFKERDITFEEFSFGFRSLKYHKQYTRNRLLIRYTLEKFRRYYNPQKTEDLDQFSIEHLIPQSAAIDEADLDWIGSIENLILVPSDLNNALGEKNLANKIKALQESGYDDPTLYDEGTGEPFISLLQLEPRAGYMAKTAYEQIWPV